MSIGIVISHIVAYSISSLHFINTWCDIARNLPIKIPPFIDRTILKSQVPPNLKFQHIEFDQLLKNNNSNTHLDSKEDDSTTEIFKITSEQLHILKTKVNSINGEKKYNGYQILIAHIWRCTCKAHGLSNDQKTKILIVVDGRSRLNPPLPSGFFSNAIFGPEPTALYGDILSETLNETIERINKTLKKMDGEYLRSVIDYLQQLNNDRKVTVTNPSVFGCPNLSITSWMWLPFYEADFGIGKPINVKPANPNEGNGYILPTPSNNDGSEWALAICLKADHMQSFQKLFYEF